MTATSEVTAPKSRLSLKSLAESFAGLAVILYAGGFLITNVYLSSLGFLTFDILRPRYILNGFLFMFFILVISSFQYILYLLIGRLKGSLLLFKIFFMYGSYFAFLALLGIIINFLRYLSATSPNSVVTTRVADIWMSFAWRRFQSASMHPFVRTWILFTILFIFIHTMISLFQRHGIGPNEQYSDKRAMAHYLEIIVASGGLLWSYVYLTSTAQFIYKHRLSNFSFAHGPDYGWDYLFSLMGSLILVSALFALAILMLEDEWRLFIPELFGASNRRVPASLQAIGLLAIFRFGFISVLWLLLVPMYALGAYPSLPRQIGGGSLSHVSILVTDSHLQRELDSRGTALYMVDRTSNSALLVLRQQHRSTRLYEVANSQIELLQFVP